MALRLYCCTVAFWYGPPPILFCFKQSKGDFWVFRAETRVVWKQRQPDPTAGCSMRTGGPFAYAEEVCFLVENPSSLFVADSFFA